MPDKPTILFLAVIPPDWTPYLASKYGLARSFDLMPHKLSVLMLVAWLREHGCDGHYAWAESADEEGYRTLEEAVERIGPHAIGFSLVTEEFMIHYRIMEKLKQKFPNIPIIVGGPHATALPDHTIRTFPAVDFVAEGEGELTLAEWLPKVAGGAGKREFEKIPGLAFRNDEGAIVKTGARMSIDDINVLPDPAFDLIYDPEAPPDQSQTFPIVCSYGCYFHCTFCSVPHGHYRALDPARVVDRMERAHKQFGVDYFAIRDSFWPPKREWLDHFCDEVENRGLKIKFHLQTRAGMCTEEQFVRLRKLGAQAIAIGVEAGDPEILKSIKKGITLEMARKTMAQMNRAGVFSIAFFIFGNLGETRRTIQASIDFSRELNASLAFYHVLYPLPGAEAFQSVPDDLKDWWMGKPMPSICELDVPELEKLIKEAFLKYPLRWAYLRQHVLAGKLPAEFRSVARRLFLLHLRGYFLGLAERITPVRKMIRGMKRSMGRD